MKKVMVGYGTRPELIKLWPVIDLLECDPDIELCIVSSNQQLDLLHELEKELGVKPNLMPDWKEYEWDKTDIATKLPYLIMTAQIVIKNADIDLVIVQGDTASALAFALAAFYRKVPVAHVEAGLRTFDLESPYPEEGNRVMIDSISELMFAPTEESCENIEYGTGEITGNTGVDACLKMAEKVATNQDKSIVITCHRRENADNLKNICSAMAIIGIKEMCPVYWVTHPSNEQQIRNYLFGSLISCLPPVGYSKMIELVKNAELVITDSGGLQEECAALHTPCAIIRTSTERSEIIGAGGGKLFDPSLPPEQLASSLLGLYRNKYQLNRIRAAQNPFGDGHASERIVNSIKEFLK